MGRYHRPATLSEALATLASSPASSAASATVAILAGGTDFYPGRVGRIVDEDVLDLTGINELRGVREEGDHFRIGALATWTDLIETPLPGWFRGLKLAAREIGGVQIQNSGTVAGNLCNASPAADGVPVLMSLGAQVEIAGAGARRVLPLGEFVLGSRKTALAAGELVTGLLVPKASDRARATFLKLGARKYLVISIAMVGALVDIARDGIIRRCGIAVGSCSAVAKRLTALEFALIGQRLSPVLAEMVTPAHLAPLAPIGDVRGTADYRSDAALTLVRRALAELAHE